MQEHEYHELAEATILAIEEAIEAGEKMLAEA